jgi:succinate dehydrogenase / fumarate reductase iron-sulfur subunit
VSNHLQNLTLKIWRQNGPDRCGPLRELSHPSISDEASFLEMLDVLNEKLIGEGREAIVVRPRLP